MKSNFATVKNTIFTIGAQSIYNKLFVYIIYFGKLILNLKAIKMNQ